MHDPGLLCADQLVLFAARRSGILIEVGELVGKRRVTVRGKWGRIEGFGVLARGLGLH
jgi:hypothetical protein